MENERYNTRKQFIKFYLFWKNLHDSDAPDTADVPDRSGGA